MSGPYARKPAQPYSAKLGGSAFDINLRTNMDAKGKGALLSRGARIGLVVAQSLAARGCELALIYHTSRSAAEASAKAAIGAGVGAALEMHAAEIAVATRSFLERSMPSPAVDCS